MNLGQIDISAIKLIIWDLDDTFWEGTLSEGKISLPQTHIDLIKEITDCGVINSICSKNNENDVILELNKYDITDLFVFKSINWESKGARVSHIISDMGLRNVNVLFIDDNISNLKEVEFHNSGIITALPNIIPQLIDFYSKCPKKDISHKRLSQYKLLEQKRDDSYNYKSNEDFLRSCNIKVQINFSFESHIQRLHELSLRTNQLNFTKKRLSFNEFTESLKDNKCAFITVQDRFGDYGVVGFFAINSNNVLEHFFFSCRTIGQGIEQFIYSKLGFPQLNIVGDVATELNNHSTPNWITETAASECEYIEQIDKSIPQYLYLFKGPCDMSSMIGYLQLGNNVKTEFTFIDNLGRSIENHNHSAHIYGLKHFSQKQVETLKSECFFIDADNFESDIYKYKYKVIFLSTLIEGNYGLYRRIGTNEIIAYGHYDYPLTDINYWEKYINQTIPTYNYSITKSDLELFSAKYEYIGRTTPKMYIEFIDYLLSTIDKKTTLCFILGSEIAYNYEVESTYNDRASYHIELNRAIKEYAAKNSRIQYIELTKYIRSQNDFTNNINHFKPNVYYAFAKDVLSIIKNYGDNKDHISRNYKRFIYKRYLQPIRSRIPQSVINILKPIYKFIFNHK